MFCRACSWGALLWLGLSDGVLGARMARLAVAEQVVSRAEFLRSYDPCTLSAACIPGVVRIVSLYFAVLT